ncbi:MAG TPA: class I SAM-dependent rRNA methyltransferase [Rectinemataceae bacterium]|nr:class I SAM-dependent rRNA methyltransferase [Rectinemataceae bacterium]
MEQAKIRLKPKEDLRIRWGHPWIYDNEIASIEGSPEPGDAVEIVDNRGLSVGSAFFNPHSKIRCRLYSRLTRPADEAFFREEIRKAIERRRGFLDPDKASARIIFGEADGIPGLVADSFVDSSGRGRWLSIQFLSLGVEKRKAEILAAFAAEFPSAGVIERSEAPVRAYEGLQPASGLLAGSQPGEIWIEENGLRFGIDLIEGQKTGWFLDQRANRAAAARFARNPVTGAGRRVLDCFSNAGGFGLAAAKAGANRVECVDSSAAAVSSIASNALANGLADRVEAVEANAFDHLRNLERAHERFGLVILDPPAFAKNRASIEGAHRGYKDLNLRALKLLEPGGTLVSCSCSYWFDRERFSRTIEEAARDAGRRLRLIEERTQDLDHPIVSGYQESRYLKCNIYSAEAL